MSFSLFTMVHSAKPAKNVTLARSAGEINNTYMEQF